MLQQSQVLWMEEWNMATIKRSVEWYLSDHPQMSSDCNESTITDSISYIHYYLLAESGTLTQAGINSSSGGGPDQPLADKTSSFHYLLEKMNNLLTHGSRRNHLHLPYIGPSSLRHFLEHFCRIFKEKNEKVKKEIQDLK